MPAVLGAMPAGYRPGRRRQRLERWNGRDRGALGARVVDRAEAGSVRPARRSRPRAMPRWSASWTATTRSTPAICRPSPSRSSRASPTSYSVPAARVSGRLARSRTRGEPAAGPGASPPIGADACATSGPMRAARRDALLGLGIRDRRFGWPLEMVLRAADAGWRIEEVKVAYAPRIGRSKVTGTVRGTARDGRATWRRAAMSATSEICLIVIAKEPRAGFCKTRLRRRSRPAGGRRSPRRRSRTRSMRRAARPRGARSSLDGEPGAWLPGGFEVVAQAEGGSTRASRARSRPSADPALLVGMDTPQLTPAMLDAGDRSARRDAGNRCRARPGAGRRLLGGRPARGRTPRAFEGVPMSSERTGGARSVNASTSSACASHELPALRDVDTIDDARRGRGAVRRLALRAGLGGAGMRRAPLSMAPPA